MKSLNAKKIAAVVAGAALLGVGLAFAGPVTFQNVPIISNSGQPVVQIVVGSKAWPSDGVAAANIAAAIGNLAYTSVPVTASVNATQAASVLHVAVSSPKYSLSNPQVWLNESGAVTSATGGTYVFGALIGSVLNQGVQLGSLQSTKALQSSGSYVFPESFLTTVSPQASPYTPISSVPTSISVSGGSNGGGVSFTAFTSTGYDNMLQVTSSQFSALKTNFGSSGETESLWLTGFPVYDQASGVTAFRLMDAGGAYQAIFNKPIANTLNSGSTQINQPISLLGVNYTIINESDGSATTSPGYYVAGGNMYLASSLAPLQTVYVGHNITSGNWQVQLQDLGQPNSNGITPASVAVFYNGVLTNESSVTPGTIAQFNVSSHLLYLNVNQTFAGLYSYQKWAKLQLYTNVFKVSSNNKLNSSLDPGWYTELLWTNTTTSSGKANQLYSIVLYNQTPTSLAPGQSFSFIQNPSSYKLTFLGDTLGASSFDPVTVGTSSAGGVDYTNTGAHTTTYAAPTITNITEPAQELTVTSQINNAFTFAGQTGSTALYDLTPYVLNENAAANTLAVAAFNGGATPDTSNVILTYVDPTSTATNSLWLSNGNPISVTVIGYSYLGKTYTQQNVVFSYNGTTANTVSDVAQLTTPLYNVTAIQIQGSRAPPIFGSSGSLNINVETYNALHDTPANSISLANLASTTPGVIYSQTGQVYDGFSTGGAITYNQQNGQPISTFTFSHATSVGSGIGGRTYQEGNFIMSEIAVPSNTAATDSLIMGIFNNTAGITATPTFILNYSNGGTRNNATYVPTTGGSGTNAQVGFRTERGSKVASISPQMDTFDMATSVDQLQFSVTSASANTSSSAKVYSWHGPYTVGQATNIANVSIAAVNASIKLAATSNYTITGIDNITATPSITSATTPVLLTSLPTTPLVVLDSQANTNPSSNLILIGSGYVNTLSKSLESAYNISVTPTSQPITQAYGANRVYIAGYSANQTTSAANTFIEDLYAAASSGK